MHHDFRNESGRRTSVDHLRSGEDSKESLTSSRRLSRTPPARSPKHDVQRESQEGKIYVCDYEVLFEDGKPSESNPDRHDADDLCAKDLKK